MKGCTLLDLNTKETFVSINVSFHEHLLPYSIQTPQTSQSWTYYHSASNDHSTTTAPSSTNTAPIPHPYTDPSQHNSLHPSIYDIPKDHQPPHITNQHTTPLIDIHISLAQPSSPHPSNFVSHEIHQQPHNIHIPTTPTHTSSRVTHKPSYLQHYICFTSQNPNLSSKGVLYRISLSKSYDNLSTPHVTIHCLCHHISSLNLMLRLASLNVGIKLCKLKLLHLKRQVLRS